MPTAEEIIVSLSSQGAGQVEDDLEGMQEQTKQTTDEVENTTAQLEGLTGKFQGAMNAIIAGFAIATGGLLTQVPVLGETMGALGTIMDTLGLKIDSAIRPAVSGLNQDLLDLANDINREDGVLAALDALATGLGKITIDSIQFAVGQNVIKGATDKIIKFVFPKIGEQQLLTAIFNVDLSAALIVTTIFGGIGLTAAKVLSVIFSGLTLSGAFLITTVFGAVTVTGGMILSSIFSDLNMTEASILSAVFTGITMTAGIILAFIFGGISMTAAAILGALFGLVVMTAAKILDAIFADVEVTTDDVVDAITPESPASGGNVPVPSPILPGGTIFDALDELDVNAGGGFQASRNQELAVYLDGRDITDETARFRADRTNRRNRQA